MYYRAEHLLSECRFLSALDRRGGLVPLGDSRPERSSSSRPAFLSSPQRRTLGAVIPDGFEKSS